jgi:GTP-binding protein HflX
VLVGVFQQNDDGRENLAELGRLATTAGAVIVDELTQKRLRLDPATYIGRGKLSELKQLVAQHDASLVIFDDELSPAQNRTIEDVVGVRVIDRSILILDIFAHHAQTHEAKLQVELAQLQYTLPRLTRMWAHLGRTGGGIGTRGPGETQLEVDRRRIRTRISQLRKKIERVEGERETRRKGRHGQFRVSLVGYTNAGKSTLFNALTRADVLVADKLFATLETTTRRLHIQGAHHALISDTVGFIRKLPHHLVASFRSTLEEVTEADLLVHVVDASSPAYEDQIEAVNVVLDELVPSDCTRQLVFNKIDRLDEDGVMALRANHPDAWLTSAVKKAEVNAFRATLTGAWATWQGETADAREGSVRTATDVD